MEKVSSVKYDYNPENKPLARPKKKIDPIKAALPIVICLCIVLTIVYYSRSQMETVTSFAEYTVRQLGDSAAAEIESTYGYAVNSIKAVAAAVSQNMTSPELEDPTAAIFPLIETTPFRSIEYIRPDGMNVMNIGQPFDASSREYYINGIQGISGVWNNYHPKIAEETLMNFYTPLIYDGSIAGVITGYIRATSQVSPLLESKFFGEDTQGLLYDRQGMVICTSVETTFEKDLTVEKLFSGYYEDQSKRDAMLSLLNAGVEGVYSYSDNGGEGRAYIKGIDGTDWVIAIFIPAQSFNAVIGQSMRSTYFAVGMIVLLAAAYIVFIVAQNRKESLRYAKENAQLELENRQFNTQNAKAFRDLSELNEQLEERQAQLEEATAEQEAHIEEISLLNDRLSQQGAIVASAGLGTWYIYLKDDAAPRMKPDEKMSELLGIEGLTLSEEEIYSFWYDRILPEAVESVNISVSKIISGSFDENTYQWNHPEKGVIYVRCGGNAITQPDGMIVLSGYHADVTDIVSKEKKQQKELEDAVLDAKKANEAKSRFLSRMSHDIRTPLNGIIGLIELSDRHPDDIKAISAGKEKARVASQHLLSLVNDVLELSKLDDSNVKLAHEPFNILGLAGDVLTIAESSAAEYGVTLRHEACGQEFRYPYVYGSPLHVRQILLNIFSNAAKYNHPGGSVYCRVRFAGKTDTTVTYTVEIEDTGIGMSPEFLKQIFEPFTQEHSDARSTFQGTGLGMAIVKSLVDKMNGTIAVESEEGKGSKFTVTIPFELADEADMPKKTVIEEKDIAGMKLLLVEDNELNMEIARSILEDFGAVITEANNGQEAVDIFEQNAPGTFDAILMDVMMPVLDGYSATRKIRALDREDAKSIPIFAMTANAFEEDKQNALQAGMNGHIAKPIEIPKLIETLSTVVK